MRSRCAADRPLLGNRCQATDSDKRYTRCFISGAGGRRSCDGNWRALVALQAPQKHSAVWSEDGGHAQMTPGNSKLPGNERKFLGRLVENELSRTPQICILGV